VLDTEASLFHVAIALATQPLPQSATSATRSAEWVTDVFMHDFEEHMIFDNGVMLIRNKLGC
jgi:hypothetical protein